MEEKREYFFKKGNKFGKGQPQSARKQMEIIRRRILMVVRRRLYHEKDLSTVSTTDLIKFLGTIMPKDYSLAVKPEVNYISNVPREELPDVTPTITAEALSSPDTTIIPDTSNGTSEDNEQEASPQVEDTTSTEPITSTTAP